MEILPIHLVDQHAGRRAVVPFTQLADPPWMAGNISYLWVLAFYRENYGFDEPMWKQYLLWMKGILLETRATTVCMHH